MGTRLLPGDETPDVEDLQGREGAGPAQRVSVEGPVRVQQLPGRRVQPRNWLVESTASVAVVKPDLTRSRLLLWTADGAVWVAATKGEADTGSGALLEPTEGVLELHTAEELWVRAESTTARVSVITENWTY